MRRRRVRRLSLRSALFLSGSALTLGAAASAQVASDYAISFVRTTGATGLAVVRADGSGLTTLVSGTSGSVESCWSPDGQAIVFTHSVGGDPSGTAVAVIDVAYSRRGQPYATNYRRVLTGSIASSPVWSPLGDEVAVYAEEVNGPGGPSGIVLVAPVANAPVSAVYPVNAVNGLAWSPDGDRLAVTTRGSDVELLEVATGSTSTLCSFASSGTAIAGIDWGRTNDTLVLGTISPTREYEIHTLGVWPGATPQLVCNGRFPTWSPDDASVCYTYGNWSMYVRTLATGATKALKVHGLRPNWRR
ncbi:MAG: PD40 domain-containing protein [Planctomycetes bacterium]|nr:PD40 domain-containing protein [Planctomycetota bacterium]